MMTALQFIRDRYGGFFELPGTRTDFERIVEAVDSAVNTAVSDDVSVIAKFIAFSDAEKNIESFADFYKKHLPATVISNLIEDLRWVLEKARETATVLWLEGQRK